MWLCKGAEEGKNHPLGTVPQPQEAPGTTGETSQAGGHRSLGLGSCKSFSVNPVEIEFPLSLFTATPQLSDPNLKPRNDTLKSPIGTEPVLDWDV